jgi:hypothetical protein
MGLIESLCLAALCAVGLGVLFGLVLVTLGILLEVVVMVVDTFR